MAGCDSSRRASSIALACDALHPQVQGAQAAQGEPRLQRPGDRADQVAAALQDVVQLRVADHERAHDDVAVAGQELGHRVQHDVGAELERPLQRGESRRCCRRRPGRRPRGRPARASRCRPPRGRGWSATRSRGWRRVVRAGRRSTASVSAMSTSSGLDPAARLEVAELPDAAEVRVPRRDHQGVLADEVQHRGDGSEPRGEGQRAPALQGAERLLERRPRRVRVPPVLEVAARDVRRRHRDRRVQRLVRRRAAGGRRAPRRSRGRGAGVSSAMAPT